jgi:hypothetical protein
MEGILLKSLRIRRRSSSGARRMIRTRTLPAVATLLGLLLSTRGGHAAPRIVLQTSVAPQPGEDLAADCRYELTLPDPSRTARDAWIIFERGRDMLRYYHDPDVQAFALRHDWALLYPFHCAAKSYTEPEHAGEMNMEPSRGLGRALLTALAQFAERARHPELATAKLIPLGFSGTGSLVARLAGYVPDRMAAVIATGPGHFEPLGMDTIRLSAESPAIPQLVIAGSADAVSGTQRPYDYFRRYFDQGAPRDVRRAKQDAALLHHQREGARARAAGRRRRASEAAADRLVRLHHDDAERADGVSESTSRQPDLVPRQQRLLGRRDLGGRLGCR